LQVEGHSGSVELQTAGPKSVHSGNGRPVIAPRYLLLMPVSMPLHIVNRCCCGSLSAVGVYKCPDV